MLDRPAARPSEGALRSTLIPALALALGAGVAQAQVGAPVPGPTIPGQVRDLYPAPDGGLYYVTPDTVGHVDTLGNLTTLASGGFGLGAVALALTPEGLIAVVDRDGNLYHLPQSGGPATLVYQDLFLINEATDLVITVDGVHLVPCRTPSNGVRAIASVDPYVGSGPGDRLWSFWLVDLDHQPLGLTVDGPADTLLMVDSFPAFGLHALDVEGVSGLQPEPYPLDANDPFGALKDEYDGDVVAQLDGDAWSVAGSTLYRFDRQSGSSTPALVLAGERLRGVTISGSSLFAPSPSGRSVWAVSRPNAGGPSQLWELPNAPERAPDLAPSIGAVPGEGLPIPLSPIGVIIYSIAVSDDGRIFYGGDNFGQSSQVREVDPVTGQSVQYAPIPEPFGRVEDIEVGPDGRLYALSQSGAVHRLPQLPKLPAQPGVAVNVFDDPDDVIAVQANTQQGAAKGFAIERDGRFVIGERIQFDQGKVSRVDPVTDTVDLLVETQDTRGVWGDPFTGRVLATEWNSTGFDSVIGAVDEEQGVLVDLPYAKTINISNGSVWGDGNVLVDSLGGVYTITEDEFALWRFDRYTGRRTRLGSGYGNHPGGLTIARSRPTTTSETGWSVYLHNRNTLFEVPGVPAPAPRWVDREAPPIGRPVASLDPRWGVPRAMVPSPFGSAVLITTSEGRLLNARFNGKVSVILGPQDGLVGDLRAATPTADGGLLIANADGRVWRVLPLFGWAVVNEFLDPQDDFQDVRGVVVDPFGTVYLVDRPAAFPNAARIVRLEPPNGWTPVAWSQGGVHADRDPLTGQLFVSQQAPPGGVRGEILRLEPTGTPYPMGHWKPGDLTLPRGFEVGPFDGGLAFDAEGDFFVAEGETGRILAVDRSTNLVEVLAGSYERPVDVTLAASISPVAGPQGVSLFVLDGYALYEHGIDGSLPTSVVLPNDSDPIDLVASGKPVFGGVTPVEIRSPDNAGGLYVVLPSLFGKQNGFPLAPIGNPFDERIVPLDFDPLFWNLPGSPVLPGTVGFLDLEGKSTPGAGVALPNDPSLKGLGAFLHLTWLVIDPLAFSLVADIGTTSHVFIGEL